MTGGDPITARLMRQDFFTFTPQFTLMIAGNHKPRLRNFDEAMRRRIHMVPFTVRIANDKRDPKLLDTLKVELPGILQWAIEGCIEWQQVGLNPPSAVLDTTNEYFAEQDPMSGWLEDRCILDPGARASTGDLYQSYAQYASGEGHPPMAKNLFSARLETEGFSRVKLHGARAFQGVGLRTGLHSASETANVIAF